MPWDSLDRRLGGPQSLSGLFGEGKIFDPTGTPKPVASCYTDYATLALKLLVPGASNLMRGQ
jgi:hypothetical protein